MTTYGSQFFWLVITFGIVYLVIGRGMLPKIQGTVEMREKRISDDVEAARLAHKKADELEEEYKTKQADARSEAQAVIAAAKDKAAKNAEKRLRDADKRVASKLEEAEKDIEEQRVAAMAELQDVAAEATQSIFAKLTGSKVTKAEARSAVKGAMTDA
ncbi:ATPase [Alterisphingorhabdus coralli]|uniref:ATP synthase subunit b n=1 Tax=Alterisphingorhabdus coralli TaxID=3071408 RepID=A0AA97F3Y1_9SPHN|nr:ATPase [Parasphingorhabdus sp. SCSIO 66989]WOE73854.1 ATPase [Parasphingorhabdus sp. SCSIO 66989]